MQWIKAIINSFRMRRGEEMHTLRLFIDITRSDFKKDWTIYEFLFSLHPELFCKVTELDLHGPWYSKWNRNLCPWFMNDKAILIFAEDLPVFGRWIWSRGYVLFGWGWRHMECLYYYCFHSSQMWGEPHVLQLFPCLPQPQSSFQ